MSLSFKFKLLVFVLLLSLNKSLTAQNLILKQQFGLPTKNINDLLIDRKGFLWIASDLGISRFDGVNYTSFTHPLQSSIGANGLLEDRYDRIWFTNLNGQILYIQDDQTYLLKTYNSTGELAFPKIALFNDKLIATSDKGLFVLELSNLNSKYVYSEHSPNSSSNSIAVLNNKVLVHGKGEWFLYKDDGTLKRMPSISRSKLLFNESFSLQNIYSDNTSYSVSNPLGIIDRVYVKDDTVYIEPYRQFRSFINSITTDKRNIWFNTANASYSLNKTDKVIGYNITDVVTDHEGNHWFSSLNHGLFVNYIYDGIENIKLSLLDSNDLVTSITKYDKKLLLGTQDGALIQYDPILRRSEWKIHFPENGLIYNISQINATDFLVGSSITTYLFNAKTRKIIKLIIKSVKQVASAADITCVAATSGVYIIPKDNSRSLRKVLTKRFGNVFMYDHIQNMFVLNKRAQAISYYPELQTLMIAFKEGLYEVNKMGLTPFIYNKNHVYATSLEYAGNRLLIGTITNGLLVVEKKHIKRITINDGLFSSAIFKLKHEGSHVWILGSGLLQLFDLKSLRPVTNYEMPLTTNVQASDISEIDTTIYVITSNGLFRFPLKRNNTRKISQNYIVSIKVNNEFYLAKSGSKLKDRQNNILFKISIASYKDAHDIYFKYRLDNGANSAWQTTEPGERAINFSSLMPGKYTFKAFAIDPRHGEASNMINYQFTILAPWWHQPWFKVLVSILTMLCVSYIYLNETLKKMALRRAYSEQQQSIKIERQRISSEIHDDIGAGIFAINLFADLANKKNGVVEEMTVIKTMIDDLSAKIREIIWTTNVENDNLENLLYFIQYQVTKLFEHTTITLTTELPEDFLDVDITSHARRNIYLIVKEIAHNTLKHSQATTFEIIVKMINTNLYFSFKDNGIGFENGQIKANSMGLKNLRLRIERLRGQLVIGGDKGTTVTIIIPLSEIIVENIIEREKKLMSFFKKFRFKR